MKKAGNIIRHCNPSPFHSSAKDFSRFSFRAPFQGGASIGIWDREANQRRFGGYVFPQEKVHAHFGHFRYGLHDGGTSVVFVPKMSCAVESDDLYIFRNFLV